MATKYEVCPVDELPIGARKIVDVAGRSIGVFNVNGKYHAIRNVCPHQRAPLCLGKVTGTNLAGKPGEYNWAHDGEIVRCPWHGWEFSIVTGKSVFNPHRMRVKSYEVTVEQSTGQSADGCSGACEHAGDDKDDPTLEKYRVTVERQMVVLHV